MCKHLVPVRVRHSEYPLLLFVYPVQSCCRSWKLSLRPLPFNGLGRKKWKRSFVHIITCKAICANTHTHKNPVLLSLIKTQFKNSTPPCNLHISQGFTCWTNMPSVKATSFQCFGQKKMEEVLRPLYEAICAKTFFLNQNHSENP